LAEEMEEKEEVEARERMAEEKELVVGLVEKEVEKGEEVEKEVTGVGLEAEEEKEVTEVGLEVEGEKEEEDSVVMVVD